MKPESYWNTAPKNEIYFAGKYDGVELFFGWVKDKISCKKI